MRILVIEDYAPVRQSIAQALEEDGFAVDATGDGKEGLWYAQTNEHDVILLDLMLPQLDGLSLLRELRASDNPAYILIVTAKDTLEDRLAGLDLGADDYLVKPFALAELLARVRALVRRKYQTKSPVICIDDLEINTTTHTVRRAGRDIDLTAREFAIIEFLALRKGEVVSRTAIWQHVYDFHAEPNSNVVDVHVTALRKKLEHDGRPRLIHTRRGEGYLLGEPR